MFLFRMFPFFVLPRSVYDFRDRYERATLKKVNGVKSFQYLYILHGNRAMFPMHFKTEIACYLPAWKTMFLGFSLGMNWWAQATT